MHRAGRRHPSSFARIAGVACAVLAGCGLDAERYEERYLDAFCAYQETCDPPLFTSGERCRESESDRRESFVACALDPGQARACLSALEGLGCQGSAVNYPAVCQPEITYSCPVEE